MDGISINDPTLYAYSNGGVAIQSSTIGAPITTYNPEYTGHGLRDIISRYEWNVNAVSACFPVITIGDRVQLFRDHAELHAVSRAQRRRRLGVGGGGVLASHALYLTVLLAI